MRAVEQTRVAREGVGVHSIGTVVVRRLDGELIQQRGNFGANSVRICRRLIADTARPVLSW
ncbi:hypothetical protein [Rhodococcus sp. BS-15]|uniref:hypothetical protein n=1 Tax=Rhodococcus sp. BS-15 TaxID=1304954 RepID=UPI000A72BC76|nr:hypothetical protein [Rhodococcus sp. BS-15]